MVSKLRPGKGDFIWEPCAGRGHLIDGVIAVSSDVRIRASEINSTAVDALQVKYQGLLNIDVRHEDALDVESGSLFKDNLQFTRVLANPPYGAYLSPARRALLKKRYPKLYVRETYGVILHHSVRLTRNDGRIVFIIPDTFLWLHRHEYLRRNLLTETTIEEIALFPSKFFPGVRFGYSGLCIVTLVRTHASDSHRIRIVERLADPSVLLDCAAGRYPPRRCSVREIPQKEIRSLPHSELVIERDGGGIGARVQPWRTLGDVAEVRTGFYSGNDRRWIRRAHPFVSRSKHYRDVDSSEISRLPFPSLNGINNAQCFVPILRGGAARFVRLTLWYVDWSVEAVAEYNRSGKNPARFQNSQFYFKEGIGVPMVASARLNGALLKCRLFDQGIVGIFPSEIAQTLYWLGFLNTKLATSLLREINPTANNSANYLKRLPVVLPGAGEVDECNRMVAIALDEAQRAKHIQQGTMDTLESFYRSIWSRVMVIGSGTTRRCC